jgi:hypothetical protein
MIYMIIGMPMSAIVLETGRGVGDSCERISALMLMMHPTKIDPGRIVL